MTWCLGEIFFWMSGFPLASMFLVFPLVLYMIFCGDPILLEEGGGGGGASSYSLLYLLSFGIGW